MCQPASRQRIGSLAGIITPCIRGTERTHQPDLRTGNTEQNALASGAKNPAAQPIASKLIGMPATGAHAGPVAAIAPERFQTRGGLR
jgi:hypothetical protein